MSESTHHKMTWTEVEEAIATLLGQFKEDNYAPSHIIAVAKGGVIPATLIHQAFPDAHFDTVYVRSYSGEFINKAPRIIGKRPAAFNYEGTLIVDDILETGATSGYLKETWPKATYAFMVCRYSQAGNCIYRGRIQGPGWIDFPWEPAVEPVEIPF